MTALAISSAALCWSCSPVRAAEVWTCTYPGFSRDQRPAGPVIARYREADGFLIEEEFQTKYRILESNQYGVIAVWSISEIEPSNERPSIGAMTIVINKATGEYLRSNTILDQPDKVNGPTHGKCLRG
jgi:hypothetical protein